VVVMRGSGGVGNRASEPTQVKAAGLRGSATALHVRKEQNETMGLPLV
jgi:hypothetical protein